MILEKTTRNQSAPLDKKEPCFPFYLSVLTFNIVLRWLSKPFPNIYIWTSLRFNLYVRKFICLHKVARDIRVRFQAH